MNTDADIAICGAGPVGLALALLLVRHGMDAARIVLLDAKPLEQAARDPRSIALSFGSRQILEHAGAWPVPADTIHQIHVSRRGRFGRTLIDRDDYGIPALGYVARYGALVMVLADALARTAVAVRRPARVERVSEQDDAVELLLADGKTLRAGLIVQAEGGMFGEQEAGTLQRDYAQTAVIAHVRCDAPVPHRAFERFTDEGPLALLPQDDGYAMVWCASPATAQHLQTLSVADFLRELEREFGGRLGRFTSVGARAVYPLGLNANPAVSTRGVAIGNAAQTLHPVAGQGLNLGLRDAAVLARLLARAPSTQSLAAQSLAEFARLRKADRGLTIRLTDTMARIFATAPAASPLQTALGLSLAAVDALSGPKRLLAEQMMFGRRG